MEILKRDEIIFMYSLTRKGYVRQGKVIMLYQTSEGYVRQGRLWQTSEGYDKQGNVMVDK